MKHAFEKTAVLLFAAGCLSLAIAVPAFGAEASTIYTLTYPNGEVVTTTDKDEAEKLLDEWKLLETAETDENGDIVLEDWASEGEILIREKEVPEGYTAESTDTTANLSDGEVTIVNTKIVADVTEPEDPDPSEDPTNEPEDPDPSEDPKNEPENQKPEDQNTEDPKPEDPSPTKEPEPKPASAAPKPETPSTGDTTQQNTWLFLMAVGAFAVVGARTLRAKSLR